MPVVWTQNLPGLDGMKYKPVPLLGSEEESRQVCEMHFDMMSEDYGSVMCLDMLDDQGIEKELQARFEATVAALGREAVRYTHFDFHKHCGSMKYENLSILLEQLKDAPEASQFASLDETGAMVTRQNGILRVNCLDCLDRTNLAQSVLARQVLSRILSLTGFGKLEGPETDAVLSHKSLWADNGDYLAIQYTGTEALKGDFTRTGHRTVGGLLNDGMNSVTRYYINNFLDEYRQDSIDLLLGKVTAETPQLAQEATDTQECMKVLEECRSQLVSSEEGTVVGWVVVSINKWGQEQERVVLLSEKAWYRVKYHFEDAAVLRWERTPLEHIVSIEVGPTAT